MDRKNANALKKCNRMHEVRYRELEMKAREAEELRVSLRRMEVKDDTWCIEAITSDR